MAVEGEDGQVDVHGHHGGDGELGGGGGDGAEGVGHDEGVGTGIGGGVEVGQVEYGGGGSRDGLAGALPLVAELAPPPRVYGWSVPRSP